MHGNRSRPRPRAPAKALPPRTFPANKAHFATPSRNALSADAPAANSTLPPAKKNSVMGDYLLLVAEPGHGRLSGAGRKPPPYPATQKCAPDHSHRHRQPNGYL